MSKRQPTGAPAFPHSVKIGYRTYRIIDWNDREAMATQRYGEHSDFEAVIRVSRLAGDIKAANTLLHELMHALWRIQVLGDSEEEERCVTALANGLCGVWVDNPEVWAWIDHTLKGQTP